MIGEDVQTPTLPPAARDRRGLLLRACAVLAMLTAAAVPATWAQAVKGPAPLWAWSGAVTPTSATVKARVPAGVAGARLTLQVADEAQAAARAFPRDGIEKADANGLVTFVLDGLRPGTRYKYVVESEHGPGLSGTFRTFADGSFSFRMAFASCASTGSNHPVFDAIRALSPDLFIHMGDFHYENIGRNDPARFRRAYDEVLRSPRQSTMFRAMPFVYVWDDHDFGPNDADGSSASKPAAFGVYRQFVPHYPLGTPEVQGVNQAFTVGRVRVIVTDNRSQRTPGSVADDAKRTMLGPEQLAWFEQELKKAAEFPLVVWVNTVPWITRQKGNTDGWERYARERTRLADLIAGLGLANRLVMLSGDAHMVAIDDGTNSNYATGAKAGQGAFPVVHAAPMDRKTSEKGGPYSNGVSRRRGQFGFMDLIDDGKTITAELTGRNSTGGIIPGMRIVVACQDSACKVVESDARPRR
jgi:phosphodiesterase/alkaline phosphatase D-like protein